MGFAPPSIVRYAVCTVYCIHVTNHSYMYMNIYEYVQAVQVQTLRCVALRCGNTLLYCAMLRYVTLRCTALRYVASLNYITFRYDTLHCKTQQIASIYASYNSNIKKSERERERDIIYI